MRAIFFADRKLRPGSSYQLAEWNQLNIEEKKILSGLYDEADVYGIFKPVFASANLTQKVAYKEVALLYLHLQHAHQLPRYLFLSGEEKQNETIAQLILDGILEIEFEGNFISGTSAVKAIFGETLFDNTTIPDRLSVLSMKAIQYGLLLRNADMRSLSQKLYAFNTIPWTEDLKLKFNADHSVKEYLLCSAGETVKNLLRESWQTNTSSEKKYWLSWWKKIGQDYSEATDKPTFKLYFSPFINDLPKVFNLSVPVLSASGAFNFKIGGSIQGLLRPDKMVAYFDNKKELMGAAALLKKELAGFPGQGVPFTAQLDQTGLLSWGVDPPESDVLSAIEAGSWRLKVTDQLALAIIQAQTDRLDLERAVHFIRAKLLSAGINTADWTSVEHSKEILS